jgi:hypothetical protein
LVFAAETATESGNPVASHNKWIFEPGLPRSTGLGPVSSPFFARTAAASTTTRD